MGSKIFVDACLGRETPYTPVWMMRQAGRYLPQYMAVRERAGNFLTPMPQSRDGERRVTPFKSSRFGGV